MRTLTMFAVLAWALAFAASAAQAAIITVSPITFASASDYDNNASQTTGVFRDITNGSYINRGNDNFAESPTPGTYTALNFNDGVNNQTGGITLYDTTPSTTTPTKFGGTVTMSTDVITYEQTNGAASRLWGWYDATNDLGIALVMRFAGGTKTLYLATVKKDNSATLVKALATLDMGSVTGFAENAWLRATLDMSLSGTTLSLTGKVYAHASNSPTSAVGSQLGSTLTYSGSITSGDLASIEEFGQVGMAFQSAANTSKASFTNFAFTGNDGTPVAVAGGPYTVAFNGNTNLDGSTGTGSYGNVTTWAWNLDNVDQGSDGNLYDDATGQTPNLTYDYLVNTLGLSPDGVARAIGLKVTNDVSLTSTAAGSLTIMPEPATLAFLGFGAVGLLARRRRK